MATQVVQAFPLSWPTAYPRTKDRSWGTFKVSFHEAFKELHHQLGLMGADCITISTNVPLNRHGIPYSDAPEPKDPGVAVYFKLNRKPISIACDKWTHVHSNMQALNLTIQAMRGLERWGASQMLERVFQGFSALPSPMTTPEPWWEVLRCPREWSLDNVEGQYRRMIRVAHPDTGGTHHETVRLNQAMSDARAEKGARPNG